MKLRTETMYIAAGSHGEKTIPLGCHARLIFKDGSYLIGDIEAISDASITLSRSDGEYIYNMEELEDILI